MSKIALITGVTGQDGSYLAQFLLQKNYEVVGTARRNSTSSAGRLEELGIYKDVRVVPFELLEYNNILNTIEKIQPAEIYNLAAQSFVAESFEHPLYTGDCDALGVTRLLEATKKVNPKIRFYQASSSEMFGKVRETPQTELTPFHPRSPYGVAKLYGHWITVNYREAYGIHACSGILFNHESPMRGREFVTRKITLALAKIKHGQADVLELGNLDAQRDWGFAGDYVTGMWQMLQHPAADDFVLASGATHNVRNFVSLAASALGYNIAFEGDGVEEQGIDTKTGKVIVRVNPSFFRPAEVDVLHGDPSKAIRSLGWKKLVSFPDLVRMMVEADERRVRDVNISF